MESRNEKFEPTPSQWRTAAIVMSIMFVVALGALIFYGSAFNKHKKLSSAELESVESQKVALANELSGLVDEYELQISDNEMLKDSLEGQLAEVETLQTKVRQAESQLKESKAGSKKIKAQLEELENVKSELETAIASLTEQNETLESANTTLKEVLAAAEADIDQLEKKATDLTATNEKLVGRLTQIAPAGFTAENFVVTAHRRNDKLTNKASRADVISVAFDIDNVPGGYKADHEIYLVLTDINGTPVAHIPTIDANVKTGDKIWPVQAAHVEKLTLEGNQLIEMSISPDDDLEPGAYNLMVYADNGYLGSTGFRLR